MIRLLDRIGLLVRARYPILQLHSHEEQRVGRALAHVAERDGLLLFQWRCTTGLVGPDGQAARDSQRADVALEMVSHIQEPALFVFYDLQSFFADNQVVRRMRDLAASVGRRRQALVLVGADLGVPEALSKEVALVDVPLPASGEVSRILAALLEREGIELPPDRFDHFVRGALGLTDREIKRLYARILLAGGGFSEGDLRELIEEKRQAIRRSRYLEFWDSGGSIDDVAGMDALKGWLTDRSLGFTAGAREFGLPEPRGLFLLGVQGCGKSLMAKAVADMWKLPLLRLDVAAVFESGGREGEGLRQTIKVAETLAPVVLWIDELEKGFAGRDEGGGEAFGYFLTWMQEKQAPVFVVATANEVRRLPPELLRKGRFDEIFFVDLPDTHERLEVLRIHLARRGRDAQDFDLVAVAEETEKFSGAELEQVVVSALFAAFAAGRQLTDHDLLDVVRETVPLAVTMDDRLKELREWARPRARRASMDRRRIDFFSEWEEVG